MQQYERTETQKKIIEGLKKVHRQLIKNKIRNNGVLVVLKEDKILKLKPNNL